MLRCGMVCDMVCYGMLCYGVIWYGMAGEVKRKVILKSFNIHKNVRITYAASTITPTPVGLIALATAIAICLVNRSCTKITMKQTDVSLKHLENLKDPCQKTMGLPCNRRLYISTILK